MPDIYSSSCNKGYLFDYYLTEYNNEFKGFESSYIKIINWNKN